MKEIPLTRGYVALVDDADYDELAKLKWCALVKEDGGAYAVHYKVVNGKVTATKMHRLLCPGDHLVDHKNGNGLDNRRENLRPANKFQNMWNRRTAMSACGYKGVTMARGVWRSKKWSAVIYQFGKRRRLGFFKTPEEAARAYDAAAVELFGEFAATNASLGLLPPGPLPEPPAEVRLRACACGTLIPIMRGPVRCKPCMAANRIASRAAYNAKRRQSA